MSNSPLVVHVNLSPNQSGKRVRSIDRITPHCVVGQCSVERLGELFAAPSFQASSNYGIGSDGRVGMYVLESERSWCSSSASNDQRAVTIECASDTFSPYAMRPEVYKTLVDLCVDICRRNGKTVLLWWNDREKALNYNPRPHEMVLTVHRWFANKECPGEWLFSRLGELADTVTKELAKATSEQISDVESAIDTLARDVIRGNWGTGLARKNRLYQAIQKRVTEILKNK